MKLTVKNPNIPIKAIPEQTRKAEMDKFMLWITNLLGLKGEESAKRLILAMPIIEKKFWSMGFNDIQKAFEAYALGETSLTPRTNYFDIVLVGQIFNEYKKRQQTQNRPMTKDDEDYYFIVCAFDTWKQGILPIETGAWLYDYFVHHKKWVIFKEDHKKHLWNAYKGYNEREKTTQTELIKDFFSSLDDKGIHIKHFIKSNNY